MRAPINRRGAATRSIGRRATEPSPCSTQRPSMVATRPASSRIPVPELPTSMTASGSRRCPWVPSTNSSVPLGRTLAPRATTASRVWLTSAPRFSPARRDVPDAQAATKRARCDMDLSPGTRSRPRSDRPPAGSTTATSPTARSFTAPPARHRPPLPPGELPPGPLPPGEASPPLRLEEDSSLLHPAKRGPEATLGQRLPHGPFGAGVDHQHHHPSVPLGGVRDLQVEDV